MSKDDSQDLRKNLSKGYDSEAESPCLSHYDAECQKTVVAPAVGFEPTGPPLNTNELDPHAHLYAHLNCADLQELVQSWENLPKPLRAGVMALIRSHKEGKS